MPMLEWIGKDKVINHHQEIPFRILKYRYGFDNGKESKEKTESENKIIHGDNLEALKSLLPEYEGKVKCIYIDPPYNTGKENWIYNDNVNHPKIKKWLGGVVEKEGIDLSRHDKWLCMMYPRLKLLQKLLKENGVIFISIDDNEEANLKLICDEIFGSNNFVSKLVWRTEGHSDNQFHIKVNHEYILTYVKNRNFIDSAIGHAIDPTTREESNIWKGYAENSITKNGKKNPPSFIDLPVGFPCLERNVKIEKSTISDDFYIEVNDQKFISKEIRNKYNLNNKMPVKLNDLIVSNYKLEEKCTVYSGWANANKLKDFIDNGFKPLKEKDGEITFYLSKNGVIYYKKTREKARNILSVITEMGTTEQMKTELERMEIKKFDYPKPNKLIEYLLKIGAPNSEDIILDSFAGSGTTGHAVLNLNQEDGGKRKFILIELEEYADTVTAKRIKKVITGYGKGKSFIKGIKSNFNFYELGERLFTPDNILNKNIDEETLRNYIYYTETGEQLVKEQVTKNKYYLGSKNNSDYYFYYDSDKITKLNYEFLLTIDKPSEQYIIYADACSIDKNELLEKNIIFKKIPRDITQL
ncbi:site-specific DNA-methyltransferase [Propionigenium maris DSM 9537]|uniref:Site-specific DNA-methyltransferase n=1 Tax=Propionigenium maris DSM 9537 TaxID=1123000 RepID=A0A9W6GLK3_9FUSO|nr:site-specific DNA-methyltransferase [Propionigenium maris]GLI57339.1 site-specific DNA-methyltransferase [Propionigenium maris DSM 9537]